MADKSRLGHDPLGGGPSWIQDTRPEKQPKKAPSKKERKVTKKVEAVETASTKGLAEGWTRATVIVKEAHLKKLKVQALRDGKPMKTVLDEILTAHYKGKTISVKE